MQYNNKYIIRKITIGENLHWKSKISISMSSSIVKCQKNVRKKDGIKFVSCRFLSKYKKIGRVIKSVYENPSFSRINSKIRVIISIYFFHTLYNTHFSHVSSSSSPIIFRKHAIYNNKYKYTKNNKNSWAKLKDR